MTTPAPTPPLLLRALQGETLDRPPVWFMRQAGRYLPEYRALRAQAPDFIAFCLNPDMAAEATLQPMRRFGFDAAIIFADILLIPRALGQDVWFEAGEGPRLGRMPESAAMAPLAASAGEHLSAVGGSLSRVRAALEPERALIGFCGAPWTVATYMLDGEARTIGKGDQIGIGQARRIRGHGLRIARACLRRGHRRHRHKGGKQGGSRSGSNHCRKGLFKELLELRRTPDRCRVNTAREPRNVPANP